MEVIDISKFYQFEPIPNPLLIASDIIHFNQTNKNIDRYVEIDNCKQWFNQFNAIKYFQNFDQILITYFKNTSLGSLLAGNNNIKKVLNTSYVYLIIKTTQVDSNSSSFTILPISNYEELSNTAISRLYLHRDGLFEINPNPTYEQIFQEKSAINHRFYYLNELLTTQGVFDSELDTKTKDLTFQNEDNLRKRKGSIDSLLGDDSKLYSTPFYENLDYLPELDPEPDYLESDDKDSIWLEKYGIPRQDYEYNEAEMDNILFNNPIKYCKQTSKEIFPVFENFSDAENFLLTIFEDLLEPLKKKKISMTKKNFFELSRKEQYTLLLPNSYILNIENSEILDPSNLEKPLDSNSKAIENSVKIKWFNRKKSNLQQVEKDDFGNNYNISNFDQNVFLTISNSFLLDQAGKLGIIKIPLGDFLSLWFSQDLYKEENFLRFDKNFLKYINNSKSNNTKSNLLFVPRLIAKNQNYFDLNHLNKFRNIKEYNKIFKTPKLNSARFKVAYQLGKFMDLCDVNSLVGADLKL